MPPFDRQIGLRLLNLHQLVYEATGGMVGHRLGSIRTLLLRTRGRMSGDPPTAALLSHKDGDSSVVAGTTRRSDKPPDSLRNLQAKPCNRRTSIQGDVSGRIDL